ncbi:hypothetical protein [Hydrogenophaga palleronii]|uniref:hypothetical protein n=1 Tax=Hydrogenophaga palleronii TaxID=65655 RepID=UPI00286A148D|nr:hypothetical protein [Hydrogenophaga palleronii]
MVVLISCSACSKGLSVDLFNNSESPLVVSIGAQKFNIAPQQLKRILLGHPSFEIHQGFVVWKYFRSLHGPQVMSDAGRSILDPVYVDRDDVIRAQVDGNGYIYILRRDEGFPIQDIASQPPGYPLAPSLF